MARATDTLTGGAGADRHRRSGARQDKIDLVAVGGSSFIGENKAFTGVGEVRALITATGWTIEANLTGDTKADFSIAVIDPTHTIDWAPNDFVLMV